MGLLANQLAEPQNIAIHAEVQTCRFRHSLQVAAKQAL
jgi:hypothetical protein